MNLPLIRNPAYLSLEPKELEFLPLQKGKIYDQLYNAYSKANFFSTDPNSKKLLPFYVLEKGSKRFFLKVIPKRHKNKLINADKISSYLYNQKGINVLTIIERLSRQINENFILCYKYVDGSFCDSTDNQLKLLGKSLAKLHYKLSKLNNKKILNKTKENSSSLLKQFRFLTNSTLTSGPKPLLLKEILLKEKEVFNNFSRNLFVQPIHGDLVTGNILFSKNKVYFLDFEDTVSSFSSIELDVFLVFERLIFIPFLHNKALIKKKAQIFLKSYAKECSNNKFLTLWAYDVLTFLSIRSLITLSLLEYNNQIINNKEWNKFFYLYRQVKNNKRIMYDICYEFKKN